MKKLSQHVLFSVMVFALTLSFTACDFLTSSYDFTSQEAVDKAKEKISKEIPNDALIAGIKFMTQSSDEFSKEYGIFQIDFYEANSTDLKRSLIYISNNETKDRTHTLIDRDTENYSSENAVPLSSIDFSKIAENINKASELVIAEDLAFSGLGDYAISTNKDSKDILHSFSIHSEADSKSKLKGGKFVTETQYYSIDFVAKNGAEVTLVADAEVVTETEDETE